MEQIIYNWIKNLIKGGNIPHELISKNFDIEDGMNLSEYWQYEKDSFDNYSKIFDLDINFNVKIIYKHKINTNKNLCFIYVLNKKNKIAFKMTITVNDEGKIDSNNYNAQIVPKYTIENEKIKELGMAIKSRINLENIVCPDFEKTILAKGANFEEDSFYNVKFNCNEMQNRAITFYLKFENTTKLEKRVVFFDQFKKEDCPYQINDNIFKIKDESYPVNLALYYKDNKFDNFVYPRDISKKIILLDKAVITDVLDNDWLIDFNQSI